jgi:hypothetical protein
MNLSLLVPSLTSQQFLPGQWLDVYIPSITKPGGFSITSTPADACRANPFLKGGEGCGGYLELAVLDSPQNPPAAWLWRPATEIIGKELQVRVGGSFTWPPSAVDISDVKRLILVAGGVGINPLMSMLRHLARTVDLPYEIIFIYTVRSPGQPEHISSILFLEQLITIFGSHKVNGKLVLHLTIGSDRLETQQDGTIETSYGRLGYRTRRVTKDDLLNALGPVCERNGSVCYICGVPSMTDELVEAARGAEGTDPRKILFERWW